MADSKQKEILYALESYPQGLIYTMAPKQHVMSGFDYSRQGNLIQLKWNEGFSLLRAKVRGQRLYSVDFSINSRGLTFSCNCPAWTSPSNCKHVICALMSIKNLLQPGAFGLPTRDETYRKLLMTSLHNKKPVPLKKPKTGEYSIVMEKRDYEPDIYVRTDDSKVYGFSYKVPEELRQVIFPPYLPFYLKSQHFADYLSKHGNKHPIVIKSNNGERAAQYDGSIQYVCKTEMDAYKDYIKVTKLCRDEEGGNLSLIGDLAFRPGTMSFGLIRNKSGWQPWRKLEEMLNYYDVEMNEDRTYYQVALKRFQGSGFVFPSEMFKGLILKVQGKEYPVNRTTHTHRLTIIPSDRDDVFILKAECALDKLKSPPSYNLFKFFNILERGLTAPLRANKRRIFLYRAFFEMLSAGTKTGAEKIIKQTLSEGDFEIYSTRNAARRFLKEHLSVFRTKEQQLQFHDGKWSAITVDKTKEILLYKIPYETFGWRIFKGINAYDEMTVNAEDLFERLPILHERLKGHGIELFFRDKPVVTSAWDFAFDASRTSGIDWFEIKPEIRCNGEAVDESLWMQMLGRRGAVEKDNCVQIPDPDSQRILNIISNVYKTGAVSKERAKEIVRIPRLRILDWITLRSSGVKVKLSPEDEGIIERLGCFEKIEERPLPEGLKARLRSYQKDGYYWLSFLYENRFGACLADDMGLGKTIQAISLLGGIKEGKVASAVKDRGCPHLIVLPTSLLFNWENEIKRFYPGLNIHFYTGTERSAAFDGYDAVLTTYGVVRRDIERLKDIRFNVIIFDEAQAIKNIYADTTGAVRHLNACFKLAMTGTPLENHIGEYYSIVDLALPGLLGKYERFKPLIKLETSPALDLIMKRTPPFVLRRTKEKILKELPPKVETNIYLELTEKQKALYRQTVERVKSTIDRAYRSKTQAQAKIIALTAILKLRQLCVSPRLLFPEIKETSPKIDFLINKLKELLDENHSALVFSQFTSFLDILEEDLKKSGINFQRLDGSTPVGKRKKLIEGFQAEKGPSIFLLSLKAGGQGLNLTKASYVFHLDPWWNPAVENQASDRAHRIGQRNKVTIMRILMLHTIEEKMMALKKKKLALYKAVMEDSSGKKRGLSITRSDFDFLIS